MNTKTAIFAAAAALAAVTTLATAAAHADPPGNPVQCKTAGNYGQQYCRYADGSVTVCGAFIGCQPVAVALAPGFWDQP